MKKQNFKKTLVSIPKKPVYLFIGNGKVSKHFQYYFQKLGLSFYVWSRKENSFPELKEKLNKSTHVLLLISDNKIELFYAKWIKAFHKKNSDLHVLHFSGAHSYNSIQGLHPLMTFGPQLYDLSFYKKVHFMIEDCGQPRTLEDYLPGLENSYHFIHREDKLKYHFYCVVGGNLPHLLWKKSFDELKKLKVPAHVIEDYFQQNLSNFINDPENSLTGPLARKDKKTIREHLKISKKDAIQSVYKGFVHYKNIKVKI